jgi:GNAT superfamily N-acetyltransferase
MCAAGISQPMTNPKPEFGIFPLSATNLSAALVVADRCFPHSSDQAFLRSHWNRVIELDVRYFCPDDQSDLTLHEHFVFTKDGQVIGFGGLYRHDQIRDREWLNWFGVDPAERGRGYGGRIISYLTELAFRRGSRTIVGYTEDSEDNTSTKQFYQRLGFAPAELYTFRGEVVRLYEKMLRTHT